MENKREMSQGPKVGLGILAGVVLLFGGCSGWEAWKNQQTIAEMKLIADRLQKGEGWTDLPHQPPVGGAICIPIDGPCSQYSYRWETHQKYQEGELERYIQQVGLKPLEYDPCVRNPRFNSGGLNCLAAGVIDAWDVRINITDSVMDAHTHQVQIVVNRYPYGSRYK
ncbi:hypothetical protein ACTHQ6_10080 [Arthrobacter sp. SAFR-179]|uniref:hypothetical protein n=1 Tax=Arthrobacter sp. SAFR-179 TaxID=3387279 RepID=UPI003F7C94B2